MSIEMLDGKRVKQIPIIPYSHHDYEWVCPRDWHKWRYIKCYCDVLDRLKENPDYTWSIDNVVHSWIPFLEYCPERVEEFKAFVKEGRICILNGGISLARPSCVGEESYVRNMVEGLRFFKKQFDVDECPVLYNADTASGHSQLPQVADLGGHKYYRFQRPDNLLTKKGVPTQFWWKGLDGTSILVTRGLYGGFWDNNDFFNWDYETRWEEIKKAAFDTTMYDKVIENLPTDIVAQFLGCDDCRPMLDIHDRPIKFNEFMAEWNRREPTKMYYSNPNEYFAELEKRELPTWEGVLDHAELTYNFPVKGEHSMWRIRIELDQLLVKLERVSIIAQSMGLPYPEEEILQLWYQLFEITGHAIDWIQARDNDDLYSIASTAKAVAGRMLKKALSFITNAVTQESAMQAVVVNTLNWETEQVVQLLVSNYCGVNGFDVVDMEGNKLPYQVIDFFPEYRGYPGSEYAGVVILVKVKVPAMGYTSLRMIPNGKSLKETAVDPTFIDNLPANLPAIAAEKVCFDNGALKATFFRGQLLEVTTPAGKTLKAEAQFPLSYVRFFRYPPEGSWITNYTVQETFDFVPTAWRVMANGPVRWVYRVDGTLAGQRVQVVYTLESGSKGIDMKVETDFAEAIEGMVVFGVKADPKADIYADIPFGTEKRQFFDEIRVDPINNEPIAVAPAEWDFPHQIFGRNWCSFNADGTPVAIVSKDCGYFYNLDDDHKSMQLILSRHMPLKYRVDRWVGECPESMDGTGKNRYHMAIFFPEKSGKFADIQHYHKERAHGVDAQPKFGFAGGSSAPLQASLIATNKPNIICTAVYRDGGRLMARFFECEGKTTVADVKVPENAKKVRAVDFRGEPRKEVTVRYSKANGTAKVTFTPWKIVTLEIR
ncbi:MAG: hypothetical protein IKD06_02815 [Clostridia bacterium]|nr:hypothetical protein [Clostridia bacterium]